MLGLAANPGFESPMPSAPALSNIRILEFGDYISSAYAGRLFADHGAEVIKIEPPGAGDTARRHGPFPDGQADPEHSGLFLFLNSGKTGITLDLTKEAGRRLFLDLAQRSDVLVHNRLPRDLEALRLAYDDVRAVNPTIIMTSVTAFGQEGPYSNYKTYNINASAAGGAGHRIGHPDRYPLGLPYGRADIWCGLNGPPATMLALLVRRRTGRGQHVDVSGAECMNSFGNGQDIITYADTGYTTTRHGIRTPIQYPYTILPCKDGYFAMIIAKEHHWQKWLDLMGRPDWTENPRYQDRTAMGAEYPEEVDELIKPFLAKHTKRELWRMCRENQIPWHAIQDVGEALQWDLHQDREFWRDIPGQDGRSWRVPGPMIKMASAPSGPAPKLGEHNALVYGGILGINAHEQSRLQGAKVI